MATSGSFGNTFSTGYRIQVDWSATQSVANNTSTITLNFYLMSLGSGYTISSSATKTGFTKIATTQENFSGGGLASLSGNQKKLLHQQVTTVNHNSDGTSGNVWLQGSFDLDITLADGYHGTVETHTNVTLDTIPRASTLTGGQSWTVGGSTTFSINRADSSFTHDIQVEASDGTNYYTIETLTGVGTSYTWTPNDADMTTLFDYVNNSVGTWNQYTRITLTTKDSSGNVVGSNQYTGLITAPNASTSTQDLDFNIGDQVTVSITRAYSSLRHTLRFYVNGTLIGTYSGIDTSYTWTPTASEKTAMYNAVTNAQTCQSKLELTTYYDSATNDQNVRDVQVYTGTATVTNSNPTVGAITYLDYNTGLTTPITGNNQYIIQNKSQLRGTLSAAATPKNGATITQYVMQVAGESITKSSPFTYPLNFDFDTINASSNQTMTLTVYDSRGFTVTTTVTVNVVPYSPPAVKTQALRDNGFADNTVLSLSGSISRLTVNGVDKNNLVAASTTYQYRVLGGTYNAATAWAGLTLTMPNYTATNVSVTLANTSAWEVQVIVTDKLGSTTVVISVSKGIPIMFLDDVLKSMGVGQFPSGSNTFETANEIIINKSGDGAELLKFNTERAWAFLQSLTGASTNLDLKSLTNSKSFRVMSPNKVALSVYADDATPSVGMYGNANINDIGLLPNAGQGAPNNDLNSTYTVGRYNFNTGTTGAPISGYGVVDVIVSNGTAWNGSNNWIWQIAYTTDSQPRMFIRNRINAGSWSAWIEITQQLGSNSNGVYFRFGNGVQICWVYWEVTDQAISSAYGSLYQGSRNWTFPAAFKSGTIPTALCTEFKWDTSASWGTISSPSTATATTLRGIDAFSRASGTICRIGAIAFGYWY